LNGRDRTRAVLAGGEDVVFAPLAWSRLPQFVHASVPGQFWLDPGVTQRLLTDAGDVCAADALAVPLLPSLRSDAAAAPVGASDEVAGLPDVLATTRLISRLAAAGTVGQIAELPTLGQLAGLLPGAVAEDTEDALSDLARACLEAGADAVAVRGTDHSDVASTVDAVSALAGYYGAATLGVDGERGWAARASVAVGLLGSAGAWPELARGLILTGGDITNWWTPAEARAVLRQRGEAG
jgi:hypothetical protein